MSRIGRKWRAATGIAVVGALAAACAPGNRAASSGSAGATPAAATAIVAPAVQTPAAGAPAAAATSTPATAVPAAVVPAAGATQDPQVTADTQAADTTLSQIESDLSSLDQATNSGENDVPSN